MNPLLYYILGLFSILPLFTTAIDVAAQNNVAARNERLVVGFYSSTCPNAELIARKTLQRDRLLDPTAPAALLRVAFHDCQVQGCDASILLKSTPNMTAETLSVKNYSIRKLNFIDNIKAALEKACPNTVSCADIIIMAARDSIFLSRGPLIPIETGRRDAVYSSSVTAENDLPTPTITVDNFLKLFEEKGINAEDAVALLGAHSLGVAHCVNFANRLVPDAKPGLSPFRYKALSVLCGLPIQLHSIKFAPNDLTNFIFDNQYYKDLKAGRALLSIDSELSIDPRTSGFVANFSSDQEHFYERFSAAFVQLSRQGVLTGRRGQIRKDCSVVNHP